MSTVEGRESGSERKTWEASKDIGRQGKTEPGKPFFLK